MPEAQIGLVGLGTMGSALSLNIAEKGFPIAVWNLEPEVTERFEAEAGELAERIVPTETLEELVAAIAKPRAIILMIPSGPPVDQMIGKLRPLLDDDDMIIDAGNSDFHDTIRRVEQSDGRPYLGIGVSGGAEGARHGPAIMGGGRRADWDRVAPILSAIAANHEGEPCATWMGEEGAGHFVKAVHNGIEYADMQMIAEVYGILRDGAGLSAEQIAAVYDGWNEGALKSYLIEIAGEVARATDPAGQPMLDVILDRAGQKGTGRWTVIEAQHLAAPIPAIEAAVMARNVSSRLDERRRGEEVFGAAPTPIGDGLPAEVLERALIAGKILCYAQGFSMISAASDQFGWALPLPDIARVWREGCIIRSAMLDDMATALEQAPGDSLIFAGRFTELLGEHHGALRQVVSQAASAGLPVPALASGLAYFDMMRTGRSTANMIQGLRDFFGAHGFERVDDPTPGQHGPWSATQGR